MSVRPALLITADGEVFTGKSVGVDGVTTGEAVFNTSMTGYQEILTDPSYAGQVVVMTSPHIGNYGINVADEQSARPAVSGFVMRSLSRRHSNWRSEGSLAEYFRHHELVAVADIDTRRLTRHIRDRGAMPVAMGSGVSETELRAIAAGAPTHRPKARPIGALNAFSQAKLARAVYCSSMWPASLAYTSPNVRDRSFSATSTARRASETSSAAPT